MRKIFLFIIFSLFIINNTNAYTKSEILSANFLAEKNIINNHLENPEKYKLDDFVLRQEIAVVARGLAGIEKKEKCDNLFTDVSATNPNSWACYTIEALIDNNLIAKNKKFNPEKNITKAEAVAMIVKASYGDKYSYDSTKKETWQEQVVNFAVEKKGDVKKFTDYDALATRGFVFEIAANSGVDDIKILCGQLEPYSMLKYTFEINGKNLLLNYTIKNLMCMTDYDENNRIFYYYNVNTPKKILSYKLKDKIIFHSVLLGENSIKIEKNGKYKFYIKSGNGYIIAKGDFEIPGE